MGTGIAAFACGVIILYSGLFTPLWALVSAGLVLVVITVSRRWLVPGPRLLVFSVLAGLVWAALFAQWRLADRLDPSLEGRPLTVSGFLCSAPAPGAWGSVRFSLCVDGERPPGVPGRLRLAWYGDGATLALPSPLTTTVILKRPHGAVNPGGFRYETWLFRKGYGATGSVRALEANPAGACGPVCRYHRWRQALVAAANAALEGTEHKALALSLLLGYRGQLDNSHWSVLEATGTIHLVAISGLHLGLVAGIAGLLLRWLSGRLPQPQMTARQQRFRTWLVVTLAALGYALLAGFTVPTRRALVMVAIAGWLLLGGRIAGAWQGWLAALGLVLLADPFGPLDQGFWLSFGAVAVLVLLFSRLHGRPGPLKSLVLAQAAVFAGLWPVLSMLDQSAAWAGLVANILAIPWLSFLVMPLLLVVGAIMLVSGGVVPEPILWLLDCVLGTLWWMLVELAQLDMPAGRLPAWLAFTFSVLVLLALWWPCNRLRLANLATAVLILLVNAAGARPGWQSTPEVWIWDVGQGLSVLVRHEGQTLLYDTGPESGSGYSAVSEVLIPSLDRVGISSIDILVISHGDQDHAGGLSAFMENYQPRRIVAGEPSRLPGRMGQVATACRNHKPLQVGQVTVGFWQAQEELAGNDSNDQSCVVVLTFLEHQLLLPGDISRKVEQYLLEDFPALVHREGELTLVAPHHGSKTSSSPGFVRSLSPERVIFTAGYRHRYGHPHGDVLARYQVEGSELLNTATSGAIRLALTPEGVSTMQWRQDAPFWIRPPEPLSTAGSE
jgi:competence protein ComEC